MGLSSSADAAAVRRARDGVDGGRSVGDEGHLTVAQHQARLERVVPPARPPGRTGQPGFQAAPAVVVDPGDQRPAASARAAIRASASAKPRAAATASWSWSSSVLVDRPVARCSSTRARPRWCRRPARGRAGSSSTPARTGTTRPSERKQAEVPLAAPGFLEVGFEQEGQVPEAVVAGPGDLVDGRKPATGPGLPLLQGPARAPPAARLGSPATRRASSSPRATLMSASMAARTSLAVRTLWSRCRPVSQTGYQMASASGLIRPLRSCTSSRSRSLPGASSPRPYPPTASRATPLSSPPVARANTALEPGVGGAGVAPAPRRAGQLPVVEQGRPGGPQGGRRAGSAVAYWRSRGAA